MKKLFVFVAMIFCLVAIALTNSVSAVESKTETKLSESASIQQDLCDANPNSAGCGNDSLTNIIGIIVDTLLFALAGTCVVVVIIGGVRFTTSGGNAESVTKAKNSILYGIIGIVVAFSAYAIVHFVIGRFS